VFDVLDAHDINVVMMSQGASKTNISLVVDGSQGVQAVQVLHAKFFGEPPATGNGNGVSSAVAS
jgi:aspartate kinase